MNPKTLRKSVLLALCSPLLFSCLGTESRGPGSEGGGTDSTGPITPTSISADEFSTEDWAFDQVVSRLRPNTSQDLLALIGTFGLFQNQSSKGFVVVDSDGTVFPLNGNMFNGKVTDAAWTSDDALIVVGRFTQALSTNSNRIAKITFDPVTHAPSLDAAFTAKIGTGFSDQVEMIRQLPNSKFLVTGRFLTFNGTSHPRAVTMDALGDLVW